MLQEQDSHSTVKPSMKFHTPNHKKAENVDLDHRQFLESLRSRLNVDEATID